MKHVRVGISAAVLFSLAVFLIQNAETLQVRFLLFELGMPRALLILFVLVIGVIAGWLLSDVLRSKSR